MRLKPIIEAITKESPDQVNVKINKNNLFSKRIDADWRDKDSVAFGYSRDGNFTLGKNHAHWELPRSGGSRNSLNFPGRLWLDRKIISFWGKYPTKDELDQIIDDIYEFIENIGDEYFGLSGVDIDKLQSLTKDSNNWYVEVPGKGSEDKHDWSEEGSKAVTVKDYVAPFEIHKSVEHEVSPLKKKQREVPMGVGSMKRPAGMTQTQMHQMKTTTDEIIKEGSAHSLTENRGKTMNKITILKETFDRFLTENAQTLTSVQLTPEETDFVIQAINLFGGGQIPMMDKKNYMHLTIPFVKQILNNRELKSALHPKHENLRVSILKKIMPTLTKEHHGNEWPEEILNMTFSDFLDELKDKTSDSYMLDVRKTAEELYDKIELWVDEHLIDKGEDSEYWDDYHLDQQEREDFAQDTDFYNDVRDSYDDY